MSPLIRFCLVLHNHQPIGNFDSVYQQALEDSYQPFLDVFEPYQDLRISLHISGPLLEWLERNQSSLLDRVAQFVAAGRIEILGGAYYEPILPMIPREDRRGQIRDYTRRLNDRFQTEVRGMWIPERVWEQSLASDICDAGIQYTLLDDFHFKAAGLEDSQLHGYYLSEDNGRVLSVFPGSEQLRYKIPFEDPQSTIDYLRCIAEQRPDAVAVFGDDGEKFGSWPETKSHVYDHGWLRRFFDALTTHQDWLHTTTLSETVDNVGPAGRVYLPDASYREMTQWALPTGLQLRFEQSSHQLQDHPAWEDIQRFVRGGLWRNFRVKYPESNEMYSRMMMVSRRLASLADDLPDEQLADARRALYRGQCNCCYWHGAFGGIYLPHLRNAVYQQLISADNLLDRAEGRQGAWVAASADDFDFDGRQEVQLCSDQFVALLAPAAGGQMYELDVRSIGHNLLATIARRPEAYHQKVRAGASSGHDDVASIHDRVVFKQEGLDQRLQYDARRRKSLQDHFFDHDVRPESIAAGEATQLGDFLDGSFETRLRRNPDRIQVQLSRSGQAAGVPICLTKGLTLEAGSRFLEIAYLLEDLPQDRALHFAIEMNFAGLPAGLDDRYFYQGDQQRLGHLGTWLDLPETTELGMVDQWLGIDVHLETSRPTGFWTFPVETVSQSEGGYEAIHQSVAVMPHWLVTGDAEGRWSVTLRLGIDTSSAQHFAEAFEPTVVATS